MENISAKSIEPVCDIMIINKKLQYFLVLVFAIGNVSISLEYLFLLIRVT